MAIHRGERSKREDNPPLHIIGRGFCGTVWAASANGLAYKREDGGPDRSLRNDFDMHQRVLRSFQYLKESSQGTSSIHIQIPACYDFIWATDPKWWSVNEQLFPPGYTSCNIIRSQRIRPFSESTRRTLIEKFCPLNIASLIKQNEVDKDCLIRPYLGRRRMQRPHTVASRFTAFSLRNFPLHLDQMEALGIAIEEIHHYARTMAEALAMMHWVSNVDGNDIEFVLAPPDENTTGSFELATESDSLGRHSMWVLDFDLCKDMTMDLNGVKQAVTAFWRNDPYYPRPGRDTSLWIVIREHYLQMSETYMTAYAPHEVETRRNFPKLFVEWVEKEVMNRTEKREASQN